MRITRSSACLLLAGITFDSEFAAASDIEEMVVTAQKRSESLLEVPISIDVVSKDFIEQSGANGISDLEFALPSVNFGRGGRNTRGEIAIRGVSDFSRNIGTEARVAVYVDDVPLGRSSAFDVSVADIAQIEVLKGPQGTLFGTNTIAGAINVTTALPEDQFGYSIHLDAGNREHQSIALSSSLPITDNVLSRISVHSTRNEGFIDNVFLDRNLQQTDLNSSRFKLLYQGLDNLEIQFNFDWLEEDINATNAVALANPDPRKVQHDAPEFEQREIYGGSTKLTYSMASGAEIISITGFRKSQFEELSEEDYSSTPLSLSIFDESFEQISQELRFVSELGEKFDYVAGLFLNQQDISTTRKATIDDIMATTPGELENTTVAAYVNANYRFMERLELSVGARVQKEEKDLDYSIVDDTGFFTNGSLEDSESFESFLPKLGLNYSFGDSLVYTSISRGAKSGGWNADFVPTLENIDFDQEFATNYELGIKTKRLNGALNLSAAVFYTDFTDFQIFQFIDTGSTTLITLTNAGEATSQGVELTSRIQFNEFLGLTLNAAYTDATFDRFRDGGGEGVDYDGNDLPYAPELSAYAAVNLELPFADSKLFYLHLDYSYSDGYFSNPANLEDQRIDNFYTVNGRLGIAFGEEWEISLWGKNLSDELYLRSRDRSFLQIERGFYEEPRAYGVSLRFSY